MVALKRKTDAASSKANVGSSEKKRKVANSGGKEKSASKSPVKKNGLQSAKSRSNSSDLVESDTSESENGFFGFSAKEGSGSSDGIPEVEEPHKPAPKKPLPKPKKAESGWKKSTGDGVPPATTSREAHAKQKALVKERRAAKPNADSIQRSKQIWERLRRKSHVPKDERRTLVDELFILITGRVKDFVFKHDSVRVIQCALKFANQEQRKLIALELKGDFRTLAESRYAKFLIGKLLVEGKDETRDLIVPEFYGHVRRLINHPEAAWILDDIYRGIATPRQKAILLREWYGPEFAIFKAGEKELPSSKLSDILAQASEKRKTIMNHLHGMINQLIQKKHTGFTMLHDAMLQYLENTRPDSEEITEFIELIKGDEELDLLKNLAFTPSGARTVCLALAYGTAKDRRHFLHAYKEIMEMLVYDVHGHTVLLAAYDVVDDTVLLAKSIFAQLLGKLTSQPNTEESKQQHEKVMAMVNHLTARTIILYPFVASPPKWLFPTTASYPQLLPTLLSIREKTSKKNPATRRAELVAALAPTLLRTIESKASELAATSFGCQFVTEILLTSPCSPDDSTASSTYALRAAALRAIAALCSASPLQDESHVANKPFAARMLKTLAAGGRFDANQGCIIRVDPPLTFASMLWETIGPKISDWAVGKSAFIIVGMLEGEDLSAEEKGQVLDQLRKAEKRLEEVVREEENALNTKQCEDGSKQQLKKKKIDGRNEVENKTGSTAAGNGNGTSNSGVVGMKLLLEKLNEG